MKLILPILTALLLAHVLYADEPRVRLGDTLETVIELLGEPKGRVAAGDREYLTYHRGTVEVAGGTVVAVKLISKADADRAKKVREEAWEYRRLAKEEAAARKHIESIHIVEEALEDPDLLLMTPREQVVFWESLRDSYPNAVLPPAYDDALAAVEEEQAYIRSEAAKIAVDKATRRRLSAR